MLYLRLTAEVFTPTGCYLCGDDVLSKAGDGDYVADGRTTGLKGVYLD